MLERLRAVGVSLLPSRRLVRIAEGAIILADTLGGAESTLEAATVVMVTARDPIDELYRQLTADGDQGLHPTAVSIQRIGDCLGPNTIAAAVQSGHLAARLLDVPLDPDRPYLRDTIARSAQPSPERRRSPAGAEAVGSE